jgi:hypothetical protein
LSSAHVCGSSHLKQKSKRIDQVRGWCALRSTRMKRLLYIILCCIITSCHDEPASSDIQVLTAKDFIQLERKMLGDDEVAFDAAFEELKSRLYFTFQTRGVEYYSPKNRYFMASSLEFHIAFNSDYVTQKHGGNIRGVVSLLEWADMWDYALEHRVGSISEWHESILNEKTTTKQ